MDMLYVRLKDILTDSCFYLSAGADITPIVAFQNIIYSYVFCDLDLWTSIEGIENKFNGVLIKLKDRLNEQGFIEIQKFNLDKRFLGIKDIRWSNGYVSKMTNCEISFWNKGDNIYSILYINHDNTYTYSDLYIKHEIIPKAICELLPDGGSISSSEESVNPNTLTVEEKKKVLPEYVLGHMYSIGDYEKYERISGDVEYYGDSLYSEGENGEKIKAKKGEVAFLQIHKRKDLIDKTT
jgi:hypothetical protein